jgi:anaerobic selenocysteine-containing dehydrogenase
VEAKGGSISAEDVDEMGKGLLKSGGWWAPGYAFEKWEKAFPTPSGKFEFYSQAIAARLAEQFPDAEKLEAHLAAKGVVSRGDDLCLPHWEPAHFAGNEADYPFVLMAYRGIEYAEGGARHIPRLQELPSAGRSSWKECCEMNPEDAHQLGLREGDALWVESPAGRRRLYVKFAAGVRPGMVAVALGHGQWPPAPMASEPAGEYGLLANLSDPLAGILALQGTRVRLVKEGKKNV